MDNSKEYPQPKTARELLNGHDKSFLMEVFAPAAMIVLGASAVVSVAYVTTMTAREFLNAQGHYNTPQPDGICRLRAP